MGPTIKILAVDDNPTNNEIVLEILEDDYKVQCVSSGEEALAIAETYQPDIILLDIMMPGIDGYETCRRLRSESYGCNAKIIFLSAKAMTSERLKGYDAGADDYLTKPFDREELLSKVKVFSRLKSTEEVDQLKSSVIRLIGHELRTPLNGMLSGLDLLSQNNNTDPTERQEITSLVTRNIHRLHHLVERAIRLCQIEADHYAWTLHRVDMQDLVKTAVFHQSKIAEERQIILKPGGDQQAMVVMDHEAMRKEVLEAIINNAIRFSPEGAEVTICTQIDEHDVTVTIRDQGKGIPADQQSHLFTGFSECDIMHHSQGTGLSLAIAQRIVHQHGGSIEVDSDINQGTTFKLTLPKADDSSSAAEMEISELCTAP